MILKFDGNTPHKKFIELGVMEDHKGEKLIMQIPYADKENLPDLEHWKPSLIIANKDLSFMIKAHPEITKQSAGMVELVYAPPREVTLQGQVDMQLLFEHVTADDTLTWRSLIFVASFDSRIDYNGEINKQYPDELRELTQRVVNVEQTKAGIAQFNSRLEFPNVGNSGTFYIDTGQNTIYRFDADTGAYYKIGANLDDITTIQCI